MSRGGKTNTRIGFVFTGMPRHLTERAARTKDGAAQVLASMTIFFGNGVLSSYVLSGSTEAVQGPESEQHTAYRLHDYNKGGSRGRCVIERCNFQRSGEHHVRCKEQEYHLESVMGRYSLSGFTEPRERHSGHDLCHGNLGTQKGTTKGRVANSYRKAVEESILPPSGRCLDAVIAHRSGKRR